MPRRSYPHVTKAKRYAREVFNGKRVAGKYTCLACERFLKDLDRDDWEFHFDPAKASRACKFIEHLPHTKGRWLRDRELLNLEPWQCFLVCNIFGWVDEDGFRRFNEAYIRVARKNGKSPLAAAIGLYCFVEDNEFGAEVYSGATTEKQAWEIYRPAKKMAAAIADVYDIEINAKNMNIAADDSRFEPIIGNPGDGASPSCALIDEYHEHKRSDLYDTMATGMAAREQGLVLIITTAGTDLMSPCYEKDDDAKKILEGTFKDESIFVLIYEPDIEDQKNWESVAAMKKANPNLGVSVGRRYLERQQRAARRSPDKQAAFKTKHLNIWVSAGHAFLNSLDWQLCAVPGLTIDDMAGKQCMFGVDLASRVDFVAVMRLFFEQDEQGNLLYYPFPRFFLPENRIEEDESGQYARWFEAGFIETHDDDEIDFARLRTDIYDDALKYGPHEVAYDPWRAAGIEQELTNKGLTMVKIPQTIQYFTDPLNELEAAHMSSRRIRHPNNEVLNWMSGNLVVRTDAQGNKKPIRQLEKNKIDGMVAMLLAMNRALVLAEEGPSVYEDRGVRTI